MKTREEHQILFACQPPVKAALLSSSQSDFPADLYIVNNAVVASDRNSSCGRVDQRRYDLRKRGLAGAVATNQTKNLARVNIKRNFAQRFYRPVERQAA